MLKDEKKKTACIVTLQEKDISQNIQTCLFFYSNLKLLEKVYSSKLCQSINFFCPKEMLPNCTHFQTLSKNEKKKVHLNSFENNLDFVAVLCWS